MSLTAARIRLCPEPPSATPNAPPGCPGAIENWATNRPFGVNSTSSLVCWPCGSGLMASPLAAIRSPSALRQPEWTAEVGVVLVDHSARAMVAVGRRGVRHGVDRVVLRRGDVEDVLPGIEGQSRGTDLQRGGVGPMGVVRGDLRLAHNLDLLAVVHDLEVDPRHRAAQDVRDEDLGIVPPVIHGQVPGTVQELAAREVRHNVAGPVEDDQRPRLDRGGSPVRGRHVADDHESLLQDPEGRREPEPRGPLKENGRRPVRRDLDDGRPRPLQVHAVIEVRDQDITRLEGPAAGEPTRDGRNAVGIDIAVGGNSRGRRHRRRGELGNDRPPRDHRCYGRGACHRGAR